VLWKFVHLFDSGAKLVALHLFFYQNRLSTQPLKKLVAHQDPRKCDEGSAVLARPAPRTGKQTNSWQPRIKEQMDRSGLSKFGGPPRSG
jgi:hypothetical protein